MQSDQKTISEPLTARPSPLTVDRLKPNADFMSEMEEGVAEAFILESTNATPISQVAEAL